LTVRKPRISVDQ